MAINSVRPTPITAITDGTAQTIYTAPSTGAIVKRIVINNIDTVDHTFKLHVVDTAGTTATDSTRVVGPITVPASGYYTDPDIWNLLNADTFKAVADVASKLNITMSIYEV